MPIGASNAGGGNSIRSAVKSTGVTRTSNAASNVQKSSNKSSVADPEAETDPKSGEKQGTEGDDKSTDDGDTAKDTDGKKATKFTSDQEFYREQAALNREHQLKMAQLAAKQSQSPPDLSGLGKALSGMMPKGGGGGGTPSKGGTESKPTEASKSSDKPESFTQGAIPVEPGSGIPPKLIEAVRSDAKRMAGGSDQEAADRSQALLTDYLQAGFKINYSEDSKYLKDNDALRRLVMHGVEPEDFAAIKRANPDLTQAEQASLAISDKNVTELSNDQEGLATLKFMQQMGFDAAQGELHQVTAEQAREAYRSHQNALNTEATDPTKNALVLVSNNHPEFDLSSERLDKLKDMGVENIYFMQIDSEKMLEAGDNNPIQKLAEETGGFGTLIDAAHGAKNLPGIIYGNENNGRYNDDDVVNSDELKNGSPIANLYQDKSVFPDGFSHISLSCNFGGNEKIKFQDSIQDAYENLRPDANILGAKGNVPSFANFFIQDGQLFHSNIKNDDGSYRPITLPTDASQDEGPAATTNFQFTSRSEEINLEVSFGDFDTEEIAAAEEPEPEHEIFEDEEEFV